MRARSTNENEGTRVTERQRERETERQSDRETERQRDRVKERQRERGKGGKRDRATERQRERGEALILYFVRFMCVLFCGICIVCACKCWQGSDD